MAKRSFEEWKNEVDRVLEEKTGMTSSDLPDINYYGLWEEGVSPKSAALKAKKNAFE